MVLKTKELKKRLWGQERSGTFVLERQLPCERLFFRRVEKLHAHGSLAANATLQALQRCTRHKIFREGGAFTPQPFWTWKRTETNS
jgi:hypothetical protein